MGQLDRRRFLELGAIGGVSLGLPRTSDASQGQSPSDRSDGMERVLGIGGVFFRARNPKALGQWYFDYLGVALVPTSYDVPPWQQESGPTVFAPFENTTEYFGNPEKQWMVNFRVRDLNAMAAQLRAAGTLVEIDPEQYPNGRFARLHDPEGNPIELWEPMMPERSV